ncbi:MAG: hypothetical protein JNM39_11075 [Bdellovibrionaceae bacterium]|nr:hypothetical protein [Pseudobdellovibrionaceae bacterium]
MLHKLHGSEFDGKGAITPWFFESVDDFPSDVGGKSFFDTFEITRKPLLNFLSPTFLQWVWGHLLSQVTETVEAINI